MLSEDDKVLKTIAITCAAIYPPTLVYLYKKHSDISLQSLLIKYEKIAI